MKLQFIDTETTGLPLFRERSHHPDQPRIISLAKIITDHNGEVLDQKKVYIKPDGWIVEPLITDLTGITQEMCEDMGIPIKEVYEEIEASVPEIDIFVAHNRMFDQKMLKIEAVRLGREDLFTVQWACTMQQSTPICQLPPSSGRGSGFKWPTLQEAYAHFYGKPFEGAHDAGSDVWACKEIFFAMNPAQVAA